MYIEKKRDIKNIELRQLEDSDNDFNLIINWLLKKEIYEPFLEKRLNSSEIKERYLKYIKPNIFNRAYFIEYDRTPVGLVEYYLLKPLIFKNSGNGYTSLGIKIFIGEIDCWDYGIASVALELASKKAFNDYNTDYITANILAENKVAIKAFKRAGFRLNKRYSKTNSSSQLKDYVFMVKHNKNNMF